MMIDKFLVLSLFNQSEKPLDATILSKKIQKISFNGTLPPRPSSTFTLSLSLGFSVALQRLF
jgi:hypothetical protein